MEEFNIGGIGQTQKIKHTKSGFLVVEYDEQYDEQFTVTQFNQKQ